MYRHMDRYKGVLKDEQMHGHTDRYMDTPTEESMVLQHYHTPTPWLHLSDKRSLFEASFLT